MILHALGNYMTVDARANLACLFIHKCLCIGKQFVYRYTISGEISVGSVTPEQITIAPLLQFLLVGPWMQIGDINVSI